RFFHDCTQRLELLCQRLYCIAHSRRNRETRKGWSKGDPQLLELELWYLVNRHRLNLGIASIRPRDDRVQQRQVLDGARHWSNTGHNAHASRPRETREQSGEWDALFGWLQTKHPTKMR